jgi:hypothetical protein
VKWSLAGLDAKKNEIALETLEFAYSYSARVTADDILRLAIN